LAVTVAGRVALACQTPVEIAEHCEGDALRRAGVDPVLQDRNLQGQAPAFLPAIAENLIWAAGLQMDGQQLQLPGAVWKQRELRTPAQAIAGDSERGIV